MRATRSRGNRSFRRRSNSCRDSDAHTLRLLGEKVSEIPRSSAGHMRIAAACVRFESSLRQRGGTKSEPKH
jgi:hypothetical protein